MGGMPAPSIDTEFQSPEIQDAWGRDGARGGLSDAQADLALRALTAWKRGHGMLNAADVGVGKTRVAAALIAEAIAQGDTRLLYTTKNQNNVVDAIEEFRNVLTGDPEGELPFTVIEVGDYKDVKAGEADLPQPPGPTVYIAHSYNFAAFHEALRDVSPTVWVADEAHEYKNIAGSNRGMAWADLHGRMIDRGAVKFAYFTATPAVTLDELGYLYGLKEWPIGAFGDWVNRKTGKDTGTTDRAAVREAILNQRAADQEVGETSGITTEDDAAAESGKQPFFRSKRDAFAMRVTPAETEQVMRELKGSGHYVSVDLWRGGIEFDVETIDMLGGSPEAQAMRERYNTAAELARDISMTARKFGRLNKRDKHGGLERSMIQSYMKQLLFELRLPRVLEMADAALDAGNQVVISVHSVGGDSETVVGLSEVDAEAPLNKRLESAINAINTEEVKKEGSGAEATWVELGDIPEALLAREALRERLRDLPPMFDPIRKIEEHFGADRVASITGRVPAGQRTQLMGEFQSGQREVAVISKAGKVGISLHDVNDATRNMLVADYEWSADTFKQELGRVDRTGQRSSPIVNLVASNIAGERKFAATIAARMASLGATSKGSAESTGTDALSQFDMSGDIALNAMKNAVSKMDDADRQYFTGSKFVEFRRQRDGGEEMHPKKRPDGADMRSFLLEMLMFPVEVADRVMGLFEQEYEALMTGEVVEKLAARRTARVSGEVLRVTGLADDPPLTLFEVVDDTGKQKAIVQGYVTSYIQAIQHARGTGSGGSFKTRRYVHFTEHGGDLISGLELNTAEARRVLSFFGRHTRTALTPEQVWNDLQLGEKIEVQGPGGDEWLLHPRRDGRIQIKGATITKHQDVLKPLSDVVGFEPKGTFLFVKGDQESLAKFLERYPPVAQMEETEPEPETTARSRARRNPRPTKTPDGRTIGSSEELVKTWVLPKRRGAMVRDWTALADYFKPGEFVPSYGGERDRVVNYRRSGTGFVVDVRDAADPDAPIRSHRTRPTRAEFEETMRERGEWPEGGGPDFRTDPRAGFVVNPFGATERELPGEGSRRHEAERTATHEMSDAVVRAMRRFPQAGKVLYDFYSETLIDAVRDQGPYGGVLAERAERVVSETKRLLGEWDRARADVQGLVSRGRKAQRAVDWLQAPEDGDHPSAIYRRIQRAVEGDIEPDEIPERAREVVEGIRNLNDVTGEEFERIGLLQLRTEVTDGDQFVMDLMGDTAGDEERAFRLFTRAQGGRIFLRSPTPDLQSIYAEPTTELSRNPLFDQYVEMIAAENDMDVEEVGEIIDTIRRQHFKRVHAEIPRVFRNHPTDMWYERGDGSRELVPLLYTHPYQYAGAIVSSSAHRSAFVQEFGQGLQDRELEKVVNEALQGRVNPDDTERLLRSLAGMSQDLSRPPQTAGARALAAPDAPERDLGNWLSYMMRFPRATMLTRASVPNLFEAFGNIQSFGGGLTRFVRAMSRLNPKHYDETRKVLARHGLVQTWVMNATVDRQRFAESLPRIYREWLLRAFPTVPMWRLQEVQGAIMGIVMAEDLRNGRSTGLVRASDTFVLRNILDFTETKTQEIAAGNASEEDYLEVARRFSTRSNTTLLSLPAEESRAAGSRWFHELFPFQRYSQMKLRSFAKLHKGFLEAWKRYRADPSDENLNGMLGGLRTLAQYHVGTAAAGTLTHLFLAMLAGGAAGLQVKLEDFEDDPLKFVLEGWVYAQFGPIWTSLARIWTDRRIDNFWMFSAPASVMKETVEALMGWGDYQFLGPMERAARAGSRVSPGPRAIIDVLTSLGLTESDPQRELAISTYWEWLRDNAPPEARTEWLRAEADTREFRKHMGRAYREIRKEASTRTLERARVHLGRALQVEGKDASSVSMSIRSRRLLSRLDAEQLADLRDAIGSELFQTLQVHDQLLSQWADAVGGSDRGPERPRPPSPPRPPRGPER